MSEILNAALYEANKRIHDNFRNYLDQNWTQIHKGRQVITFMTGIGGSPNPAEQVIIVYLISRDTDIPVCPLS
ncbi:hypothetical protein LRY65_00450 [Candidatus Woesebacteria bacterium]|nr:hypothetical protein [Candidatus Woesebacteria bacterium]MCD8507042.1 hypothetical protein [Candidatus Woesebacteria bacterium]MCD8526672.1 hypothetical protein [Candidatus Woesebacteria bacterium]MCD8546697.1 hypothetical protein [Candidatus Woesebacteria bacterium]